MNYPKTITPHKASKILSVTTDSLLKWERAGKIRAGRTVGGHRRYYLDDIMALVAGQDPENETIQPRYIPHYIPPQHKQRQLFEPEPEPQHEPQGFIRRSIKRLLG